MSNQAEIGIDDQETIFPYYLYIAYFQWKVSCIQHVEIVCIRSSDRGFEPVTFKMQFYMWCRGSAQKTHIHEHLFRAVEPYPEDGVDLAYCFRRKGHTDGILFKPCQQPAFIGSGKARSPDN